MRKILLALFFTGIVLGVGQLFLVRDITKQRVETIHGASSGKSIMQTCMAISPECGYCPAVEREGQCYFPKYTQKFRGFPLTSGSYGYDSRINVTPALYANILILALGMPALGYSVFRATKVVKHRLS